MVASNPSAPARRRLRWPAASLRAYLVLVMFVATVPLAVFAFYLLQQQAAVARGEMLSVLQRTANSFALLVEHEVDSATDLLSGLAYNEALQRGDVKAFHAIVERAGPLRPAWRGVYLAAPDGSVLFASDQPYGSQLGRLRDAAALERIRATLQPTVTDLVRASHGDELVTGVQVPVLVRGSLHYVLGARIAASHWQQLSERSSAADDGFISLVDSQSRLIAHSLRGTAVLGRVLPAEPESTDLQPWRALFGGVQGKVTLHRPVRSTGWTVATGVPAAPLVANEAITLAKLIAAGALSVLLGLLLALMVARRVSTPLGQLARGGASAVDGPVVVREIRVLREALRSAAHQSETARSALQRRSDEFEALFRSSPIGLAMTLDAEGSSALINPALAALLGVEPGEHPLAPLLDARQGPAVHVLRDGRPLALAEQPLQRAGIAGVAVHDDSLELLHASGRRIQLEVHAVPLRDAAGAPRGAVAAFVDATERRELERQREQLARSEREARRAAEAANRGKDEFFAMLGHELRNPLGAIGAAVEVLNRSQGPGQGEVAASARRVIERQTRHMAQLMNDLQDVARVGAGKLQLERRRLDLAQHVWRPLDALRLAGRLRNHAITLDLQRVIVDADPVRIEQVLVNLLTNAAKYTPAGGHVELTVRPDGDAALIEVRDSGVGIAPELLPQVFDIFVQSERTADRRQGGMGLGLTLVRRLVELHGGSVHAASEGLDRGSTFTLRLPAVDREAAAAPATTAVWHGVVLGLETARPFELEALLCGAGCRVTSSSDIAAGLDVIVARRPPFVLIDAASALAEAVRATGVGTLIVGLGAGPAAGCDVALPLPLDLQLLRQHVVDWTTPVAPSALPL